MNDHKIAIHKIKGKFECNHCGNGFANEWRLTRHIMSKHPLAINGKFKCNGCDRVFPSKLALYMRKISCDHKNAFKSDVCEYYDMEFSSETLLNKHNSMLKCEYCSQCFSHETLLDRHCTEKHPDDKPHNHICNYCDERFRFASLLKEHKRYQHPDKAP